MKSFKCVQQGLAMGVVVGGFGGGAFIFNQIQVQPFSKHTKKHDLFLPSILLMLQTAFLNPDNISTDGDFFEDDQLLGIFVSSRKEKVSILIV